MFGSQREPKYKIGDVFFTTYTAERVLVEQRDCKQHLHIPAVIIIKEIIISKKETSYNVERYIHFNDADIKNEKIKLEETVLDNYFPTTTGIVSKMTETYEKTFNELKMKVNKEKLNDALKGE
jgi:hypothetical protein